MIKSKDLTRSDKKVLNAIREANIFLAEAERKGFNEEFSETGLTLYGCEKRNLEAYRDMLGKDKRTLIGHDRQLYQGL